MTIIQYTWVLQCLFSYLYHLHHPWGVFCPPLRGGHSPCPPNRGISLYLFDFRLKCTVNAVATHTCIKLCHFCRHCLHACMSSDWYFILLFWGFPSLMMSWGYTSDVIRGGNSLSYNNKLWYWQQYHFIYLIYSLFWNFFLLFPIHVWVSYWLDK